VFGGRQRLFFAAEDKTSPLAAFVRGMVDLLPEADKVVDGGDDRHDRHPVDSRNRDEVDADDVAAPVPIIPAVGEDGGHDGDDLDDGLQLADLACLNREAFGGSDAAQTGDEELAADDEDGDPGFDDTGGVGDQDDVGRGDHQLVRKRVEQDAHGGDLLAAAGEVAVQAVGHAGQDEDDAGDDLLLAAAQTRSAMSAGKGKDGRQYPDEQRDTCDTAHRDGVRQIHRGLQEASGRGTDNSILTQ